MCEDSTTKHTLYIFLNSIEHINKWDRLLLYLRLFASPKVNNEQKPMIEKSFQRWNLKFNKTSIQPIDKQMHNIRNEYKRCKDLLTPSISSSLAFTLRACK